LARRYQLSRGHALVIDAGGVLGLLAGLALPAMAGAEGGGTYGIAGLLGLAAGLGTAAAMSRDWDDQAEAATAAAGSVGPATIRLQGGGLAYGLAGRF
jgi:hypothetical protein